MRFTTWAHPARGHAAFGHEPPAGDAVHGPAAARACALLLLVAGVVAALGYVSGQAIRGSGEAAAAAGSDTPPRDPALVAGIRFQVEQMRDRGIVLAVHDGDPTVVVVADCFLASVGNVEQDLPLYGGHFVGFAGEYAWLVNGTHRVRLVRDDGTEIGRRDGPMSDAQVRGVYLENRRRRDAATAAKAALGETGHE